MGESSATLPRLLVVKGTFEQFGGAERDLLNNLSAWSRHFEVTLATLNLPSKAREQLGKLGINFLTPVREWTVPRGSWAEFRALASRKAVALWVSMLGLTEQVTGLQVVLANVDAIHVTSGVGSLEFCGLAPSQIPLHYYCLEPHRGLYEDVLHRTIDGTPKRSLALTKFLLGKQRRRDQKFVERLSRRRQTTISANSAWIQQRISFVYGIKSEILLPTVDLSVWKNDNRKIDETKNDESQNDRRKNGEGKNDEPQNDKTQNDDSGEIGNYVVTIGAASHVKGTWDTLDMLAGTGISLALVGGGDGYDLARLRERAEKLEVELNIQPRLSQDDLITLVQQALALVSLAYDEPFGLTPIEAQAAGTPALMVNEGGFKYTIQDGISGRLLPRNDWKIWHDSLTQARDLETRKTWAKNGRKNIAKMGLTPENQAARLAQILGSSEEE